MPRGWTKKLASDATESVTFVVLGVTQTGPWRAFAVLNSFTLTPLHIKTDSPILVNAIDAVNYDYVMVIPEKTALKNGWLK